MSRKLTAEDVLATPKAFAIFSKLKLAPSMLSKEITLTADVRTHSELSNHVDRACRIIGSRARKWAILRAYRTRFTSCTTSSRLALPELLHIQLAVLQKQGDGQGLVCAMLSETKQTPPITKWRVCTLLLCSALSHLPLRLLRAAHAQTEGWIAVGAHDLQRWLVCA